MEREVAFYSSDSRVAATLFEPDGHGGRCPGIVLCQGSLGQRRNFRFPEVGRALAAAGYVAISFDYRGFGESEGIRGRFWPEDQLDDVRAAASYLEGYERVDAGRLGVWGTSFGGAHVVAALGRDDRVRTGVCVIGVGDVGRWLRSLSRYYEWASLVERARADRRRVAHGSTPEMLPLSEVAPPVPLAPSMIEGHRALVPETAESSRPLTVTLESVLRMAEYQPEQYLARVAKPLLVIRTADDRRHPPAEAEGILAAARGSAEEIVYPGAQLGVYLDPLFGDVVQRSLEWFGRHLS